MEVFKLFATMSLQDLISKPLMNVQVALKGTAEKAAILNGKALALGKAMTPLIAVAGAVLATLGLGVKAAADFAGSIAKLAVRNREGAKSLELLEAAALKTAASSVFSAGEIVSAQTIFAGAGYKAEASIKLLSETESYAAAQSLELAVAAKDITDILSSYGLAAGDAARVTDTLTAATRIANVSHTELAEVIKKTGPMFSNSNVALSETVSLISALADAGIKGGDAISILEPIMFKLSAPTASASEMLKKLGISATDSAGKMKSPISVLTDLSSALEGMSDSKKLGVLKELVGEKPAYSLFDMIQKDGLKTLSELKTSLTDVNGVTKEMAQIQNATLGSSFKRLGNAVNVINITIGKLFVPTVTWITDKIASFAAILAEAAASPFGRFLLKLTAGISIGILAFGGLIAIVAAVTAALPAITAALGVIGGAAASLAAPLILIAGLTALLVLAWNKNFGGIADITKSAFNRISLIVKGVIAVFRTLQGGVGELKGELAENIQAAGLVGAVTAIGKAFFRVYSYMSGFLSVVKTVFTEIFTDLKPVGDLVVTLLTPLFRIVGLLFKVIGLFGSAGNAAPANKWAAFGKIVATVVTAPLRILATVIGFVAKLLNALLQGLLSAGDYIWSLYSGLVSGLLGLFSSLKDMFAEGIKSIFGIDLFESGKKLVETFTDGISSVLSKPKEMLESGLTKLRNLLPFSDAKEGPLSTLTLSGTRLMTTIGEGISAGAPSLYNAAETAFAGIPSPEISAPDMPLAQAELPIEQNVTPIENPYSSSGTQRKQNESTGGVSISIGNITLPSITNAEDFVSKLEQIALQGGVI